MKITDSNGIKFSQKKNTYYIAAKTGLTGPLNGHTINEHERKSVHKIILCMQTFILNTRVEVI